MNVPVFVNVPFNDPLVGVVNVVNVNTSPSTSKSLFDTSPGIATSTKVT